MLGSFFILQQYSEFLSFTFLFYESNWYGSYVEKSWILLIKEYLELYFKENKIFFIFFYASGEKWEQKFFWNCRMIFLTCSKDLRPASFPHESISSMINCLTCGLAHNTLSVPGIPFSTAQHFTTSTSGITIPTTQDFRDSPWTNIWWTYWLRK